MNVSGADSSMIASAEHAITEAHPRLRTWHVFAIVTGVNVIQLAYFNEFVLTREVYANVLGGGMDTSAVDQYFSYTNRLARWGYLASPFLLGFRIGFIALLIQFTLLLFTVEIRFDRIFRTASWAYLPVLYGAAMQSAWLHRQGAANLSSQDFLYMPASLSSVLFGAADQTNRLYPLLNAANIFELAWCVILAIGLVESGKLKPMGAVSAVVVVWGSVNVLKWTISLFASGMMG